MRELLERSSRPCKTIAPSCSQPGCAGKGNVFMAPDHELKQKIEEVQRCLERDDHVLVHINPGASDLKLPIKLLNSESVTLKFSRFFRKPVTITENSIGAELLFGDSYFACSVPFDAVWGITSEKGENIIWPEYAPAQLLSQLVASANDKEKPDNDRPPPKAEQEHARKRLRRVK